MTDRLETIAYCHSCGTAMDVSAVAPFTNVECPACGKHTRVKREFGPYTLVRRHAIGGMSMVFVAHDNTLDREVALKILSEAFSADERRIASFEEEARITASFSHPNVVRVLRTGRAFDRFYIAMELVPGGHFEHQIRERGKIPELEMLPLAIEVAHGLKAAHSAGLIHRDVKPGNILLDAEGHAKLVDFGLALVTHGGKAQATEMWATPYYVPPETVEGYAEDFRSDIYAFGATLYHALSGKPSCGEESMATDILREAKKKVVPLSIADSSLSAEICRIVERAMAYDPNGRYGSYDELISSLSRVLSHLKTGRPEGTDTAAMRRAGKKRQERSLMVAVVLVGGLVATAGIWWATRKITAKIDQQPSTVTTTPPVATDTSADIAKRYRDARTAVKAKNFDQAAREFAVLHHSPAAQEPSRTWAGVEAVLATLLDGRSSDARKLAFTTVAHAKSLPESTRIDDKLITALQQLGQFPPLVAPDVSSPAAASQAVVAMLAGLKNWEQGMLDQAAVCFTTLVSAKLSQDDQWVAIYQSLAKEYLDDHKRLSGPLFTQVPADKAGCEAAIAELDLVLVTLKTRGRAKFNVRAWQLDLARKAKLMGGSASAVPAGQPVQPQSPSPQASEVLPKIAEFARDFRFAETITYLKALPEDPKDSSRVSLLAMAEASAAFLADIENDLAMDRVVEGAFPPMTLPDAGLLIHVNPKDGLAFPEGAAPFGLKATTISGVKSFTAAAWIFREEGSHPDARIFSKSTGTDEGAHELMLSLANGGSLRARLRTEGTTRTVLASKVSIPPRRWTHVALRYDGSELSIWVDGVQAATGAQSGPPDFTSGVGFALGNNPVEAGQRPLRGTTRDFRFYGTAISAALLAKAAENDPSAPALATFPLKSGETVARVSIDSNGIISASSAAGQTKPCKWGDFTPDALIALHRVFMKNAKTEADGLRRQACAICFDWLSGNRERALAAASALSQNNPAFKKRWDEISGGLPK